MERADHDIPRVHQLRRHAMKVAVVRALPAMRDQVEHAAQQDHRSRRVRPDTQQDADLPVDPRVIRAIRKIGLAACRRRHHSRPVNPLKIISHPSAAITIANTMRIAVVFARIRNFAPSSDPASTPIVTGNASDGLMYPRLK